jgi:hypothetical protein
MTLDLIITFASILTALSIIFGGVYALYKLAKRIDAAIGVDGEGRTIADRLDKVEHQLWENGGSSLADRVNNIEHHVIKVSAEIDFIKDLTLGLHNSTIPNSVPKDMIKPLVKKRVSRPRKTN